MLGLQAAKRPSVNLRHGAPSVVVWFVGLLFCVRWAAFCTFNPELAVRSRVARRAVGATIDRPPPGSTTGGDGEEGYEVRILTNEERDYYARLWLPLASEEDKACLEDRILPFRSAPVFAGRSRLCLGCFAGESCEGLATAEIKMDSGDFMSFLLAKRVLACLAIVTKPRINTQAGSLLVRAMKELADKQGFNIDFEPVQDLGGGRYWVLSRSL
mmetsp:Transcript_13101/g.30607  ORF Transcript_13101/g.30607 Transcript_13101/m.30607 type:complete len:214 (+) Transcript_13101:55-696(+)